MTEPALLHWTILTIEYEVTETGMKITVTTNHPCHLTMRWTNIEPQKHIDTLIERGVPVDKIPRLCFVVFEDNEQEEAGDTLIHTFVKEPWEACTIRWFYFWGTVNGEDTLSESPIFERHRVQPPLTTIFYPDLFPGVTCCDGYAWRRISSGTYESVRNGAGSGGGSGSVTFGVYLLSDDIRDKWREIDRIFLLFDTSPIGTGAVITSATLSVWGRYKLVQGDWPSFGVCLVLSFPGSNTLITVGDYNSLGAILMSDTVILADNWTVGVRHYFPLNALGLSHIVKDGITRFGLRDFGYDRPNVEPDWSDPDANHLGTYSTERGVIDGVDYRPMLEVSYTP